MNSRFTKPAEERQAALDYIIANPNVYGPEIIAAMGFGETKDSKSVGADRLRDMVNHGEIERTPALMSIVNKNGHKAQLRTHTYIALVSKARTAADVAANLATNLGYTKERSPDRYKTFAPQVRDPNRKPIRNQGGQGNVRHEVRRGCSMP